MKCWVSGQNSSWSSRVNLAENHGEYWQNTIFSSATSSDPENDISGANFKNRKNIQLCGRFCRFFLKFLKFYWNAEVQVQIRVGHHEWIWLKITESIHKTLYFHLLQASTNCAFFFFIFFFKFCVTLLVLIFTVSPWAHNLGWNFCAPNQRLNNQFIVSHFSYFVLFSLILL